MDTEVAAQLAAGLIEEALDTPIPAGVIMIIKFDSVTSYQSTLDYKAKNKGIVLNHFPLH